MICAKRPILHLICILPGSGKTTFGKKRCAIGGSKSRPIVVGRFGIVGIGATREHQARQRRTVSFLGNAASTGHAPIRGWLPPAFGPIGPADIGQCSCSSGFAAAALINSKTSGVTGNVCAVCRSAQAIPLYISKFLLHVLITACDGGGQLFPSAGKRKCSRCRRVRSQQRFCLCNEAFPGHASSLGANIANTKHLVS